VSHLSDIENQKREKLKTIEDAGIYPYGEKYEVTSSVKEVKDNYE